MGYSCGYLLHNNYHVWVTVYISIVSSVSPVSCKSRDYFAGQLWRKHWTIAEGNNVVSGKTVLCCFSYHPQFLGIQIFSVLIYWSIFTLELWFYCSVLVWCDLFWSRRCHFNQSANSVRLVSALFYSVANAPCEFFNCFNYCGQLIVGTAKWDFPQTFCKCSRLYCEVLNSTFLEFA